MASKKRAALLRELAEYASPDFVARADWLCNDEQLQECIAGAKAQLADYQAAGFQDMGAGGQ